MCFRLLRRVQKRVPSLRGPLLTVTFLLALASLGVSAFAQDAWTPDITIPVDAVIDYQGSYAHGDAYVYLGAGNSDIVNPVIVVEGFDPQNSKFERQLYELLNQQNLVEDMRAEGYDAIILNFDEGAGYVQKNAMLLVELIQQIRDQIAPSMDMVVIGASMGGLVSRYALAYMEDQGLEHRVRTFISFDSPQMGANIPLGIQEFIHFWAELGAEVALDGRAVLNSPAARQMLIFHYWQGGAAPHEKRVQLLADLANLGDFPQQSRNVAIANGSGHSLGLDYSPGTQILTWDHEEEFLDVVSQVWALPGEAGTNDVFYGDFDPIGHFGQETSSVSVPAGTPPMDTAPGGMRDTAAELEGPVEVTFEIENPLPFGDPTITIDYNLGEVIVAEEDHCFIPTVSALYLDTADPYYMICVDPDDLLADSPFDAVYFPLFNQSHVQVTAENKVWFMDEIRGYISAVLPGPLVARAELRDAYPNPFNPMTHLSFNLPAGGRARLEIYNVLGHLVKTLENGVFEPGEYVARWNGTDTAGRSVGSGLYFCRLTAEDIVETRNLTLVR